MQDKMNPQDGVAVQLQCGHPVIGRNLDNPKVGICTSCGEELTVEDVYADRTLERIEQKDVGNVADILGDQQHD